MVLLDEFFKTELDYNDMVFDRAKILDFLGCDSIATRTVLAIETNVRTFIKEFSIEFQQFCAFSVLYKGHLETLVFLFKVVVSRRFETTGIGRFFKVCVLMYLCNSSDVRRICVDY